MRPTLNDLMTTYFWTLGYTGTLNDQMYAYFYDRASGGPTDPPVNVTAPAVAGVAVSGETLTASTGIWSNSPTVFSYQWRRNGVDIPGATGSTYILGPADVGQVISVAVTAINAIGFSSAVESPGTEPIASIAPVNITVPTISGVLEVGSTVTVSPGTWQNTPTSYTYQWRKDGVVISGATNNTYLIVIGDLGATLSVSVVAINSAGSSAPATSASTIAVTNPTPATDGVIYDSLTTSEVADATDKVSYLTVIMDALGTGPKDLIIRRAASGDPWVNGTVVFEGTVEGEMIIGNGALTFGEVVSQEIANAADFSTGLAVWRIVGEGGRFVQGPLKLEI